MSHEIKIEPSGHGFSCPEGSTVLNGALEAGFNLPYGCRNGACGTCKGRILSGRVDHGTFQEQALSAEERNAGYALFCCARPLDNLVIECREVGAVKDIPVKTLPCRVEHMAQPAPDVMILHLRLPANQRLQFLAGQYVDILLKGGLRRSYSIGNAPHDDELLQLHVRLVPGGRFSGHVFEGMKPREILRLEGPHGSFFLREDSHKPIICVAGGTGFAPIKSLIEHAFYEHAKRPIRLYWGARTRADLYMPELPESWAAAHPDFRYVPVLSEPRPEDDWQGRTGLVHRAVMEDYQDLAAYQVYACGAPAMIDAAKRDFTQVCKLPAVDFFADSFTYAADGSRAR